LVKPGALRVLWLANLDLKHRLEHGAHLRVLPHARQLLAEGHEIYLGVLRRPSDEAGRKQRYLTELIGAGFATRYFEIEYFPPRLRDKLTQPLLHPTLQNRLLADAQTSVRRQVMRFVEENGVDLCVISGSSLLFLLPDLVPILPAIVDWPDSMTLSHRREAKLQLRSGRAIRTASALRHLALTAVSERYYGRLATLNIVASPVDKHTLDRLTGQPEKTRVLPNGVDVDDAFNAVDKVPNRIIFTGNMDFAPNYQSAIWFIDEVLPGLIAKRPAVKLVVAGANPSPALVSRSGDHVNVTGFVASIREEIARSALYIAPLVAGGGFKNKVVEALAAGTYVVSTSMGVEFLEPGIRRYLSVADTPDELAKAIVSHLDNPGQHQDDLAVLRAILREEFTWEGRTRALLALFIAARDGRS
jgi:glycosyltransferase involved in cell wall biosynthesis